MMSYLWILLLGSLLAASAKAQDVDPAEDAAASVTTAPEVDAAPEAKEEPAADEKTDNAPEETPALTVDPEPVDENRADEFEIDEAVTPAPGDTEAEAPATTQEPAAEPEVKDPNAEEATGEEETTPSTVAPPAQEEIEPEATPAADVDVADNKENPTDPAADAQTTNTPVHVPTKPAAEPEVKDPNAEEATGEEETTPSTVAPPAQEEIEPEATPAADVDVADNKENPTDPAADAQTTNTPVHVHVPTIEVNAIVPVVEGDVSFNLDDALDSNQAADNSGKSRSFESGAHAAGAKGDEAKPEAQESSSGSVVGILCAVAVAVVGAIVGYFTYQHKKLCFKNRQEADPEAARKADTTEVQSDPQVLSNLLNSA
ncbi:fibrous sheath CABYR-binding protein [Cottoperca gobio]|uniref:Fibrous sheath CABYR-binding protein n=1 Tax=Cottoperca gobio TaxID=56716 RepID=A0A6J2RYG9_COTGO|nr:fibrous sheath CABYR-binding protein-like [Cottoperca gobio]